MVLAPTRSLLESTTTTSDSADAVSTCSDGESTETRCDSSDREELNLPGTSETIDTETGLLPVLEHTENVAQRSRDPLDEPQLPRRREGLGTYWARYGGQLLPRERITPSGEAVRAGGPNWT